MTGSEDGARGPLVGGVIRWADRLGLLERFRAWDTAAAQESLSRFEAHHQGAQAADRRVRVVDLEALERIVRPERGGGTGRAGAVRGRPLVVHHWATWCGACMEDLPMLRRLAEQLGDDADLITVSWERFERPEAEPEALVHAVAHALHAHGLELPTVVYDGAPDRLFAALGLTDPTIPLTRVIDADGGLLREHVGPLDARAVQGLSALVRTGAKESAR